VLSDPTLFLARRTMPTGMSARTPIPDTDLTSPPELPPNAFAQMSETGTVQLSVIVPVLNVGRTIGQTLAGVLSENRPDVELIVVDGGSTDNTRTICEKWGARLVAHVSRRSTARRIGAELARGEFLLFLDGDQVPGPGLLEECVVRTRTEAIDALKIPELDSAFGFWAGARRLDRFASTSEETTYPRLFRRTVYFSVGGHRSDLEDYMEDRDLFLRLRQRGFGWSWSRSSVFNLIGEINPLEIGIKGARSAQDSASYYRMRQSLKSDLQVVVVARLRALARAIQSGASLGDVCLLLPYTVVAYGPRLVAILTSKSGAQTTPRH
jgi:glycosyltransferase involved in cell wall biosynthesis